MHIFTSTYRHILFIIDCLLLTDSWMHEPIEDTCSTRYLLMRMLRDMKVSMQSLFMFKQNKCPTGFDHVIFFSTKEEEEFCPSNPCFEFDIL